MTVLFFFCTLAVTILLFVFLYTPGQGAYYYESMFIALAAEIAFVGAAILVYLRKWNASSGRKEEEKEDQPPREPDSNH